ncbi:amidohydrolase family protein [Rubritalea marina]|uniref:amidohydrolase family protein n=1 Tax=Rubritalea marina TaxID=361055 RepID=UPI001969B413|nr:amidohydrolase family protein [Rubritalea marina]
MNDRTATEMSANHDELIKRLDQVSFLPKLAGANFMVFNSSLFLSGDAFAVYARRKVKKVALTILIDFRDSDCIRHIEAARAAGTHCIKFHSYQQQITIDDYKVIVELCKYAESLNMAICLDGSYGTAYMTEHDTVDFICCVARHITEVPVIVLHSGGLKCLSICLLALDRPNIYVESSISLTWYLGSSVEQDLAYMYKKLGPNRVMFASDDPYFKFDEALNDAQSFYNRHKFSDEFLDRVFYQNAVDLLEL